MSPVRLPPTDEDARRVRRSMTVTGIVFIVAGALALLAPRVATMVVEHVAAWLLVLWGAVGMGFAASFRDVPGWIAIAASFLCVLLAGLGFLFYPVAGAEIMTAALVIVFLLEGALQILLGLRTSGHVDGSGWLIASGCASIVLGAVLVVRWPVAASWVMGALAGVNFLTSGIALLMTARRLRLDPPE